MTYTLKITPTGMALLEGYCRAAGRTLKDALSLHLTEQAAAAGSHPAANAAPAAPAAVATAATLLPSPAPRIQPPPPFAPPVPATPAEEDALLAPLGN